MMIRHPYSYTAPESLRSAWDLLRETEEAAFLAGGTDMVPLMKQGVKKPRLLISLERIEGLAKIEKRKDGLFIGSMCRLGEISRNDTLHRWVPAIESAAESVASPQIRNMGTIGGNILQDRRCLYFNQTTAWRSTLAPCFKLGGHVCHQVPKAAECRAVYYSDLAPALLSFDAGLELFDEDGFQTVPLESFLREHISANGLRTFGRKLVSGFLIPYPKPGTWGQFFKYSVRASMDFAMINGALRYTTASSSGGDPSMKIIVGAVAPEPLALQETADYFVSNLFRLAEVKDRINEILLEELRSKSGLIRETGVPVSAKRNAFYHVVKLLEELVRALPTLKRG